jgi:cysteine sulfinate desulfinase/cysteine desulfurase-like protein
MGIDHEPALTAVRLTVGRWSTDSDIDHAAERLANAHRLLTQPDGRARQ